MSAGDFATAKQSALLLIQEQGVNHVTGLHLFKYGAPDRIDRQLRCLAFGVCRLTTLASDRTCDPCLRRATGWAITGCF